MELIRVENLEKTYQDNGVPVHALHSVSLSIDRGEFAAIAGPSGSGKTTLLNLIGALDTPSNGSVFFEGELGALDFGCARVPIKLSPPSGLVRFPIRAWLHWIIYRT